MQRGKKASSAMQMDSMASSTNSLNSFMKPVRGFRGFCRDDLLTDKGKKVQLVKMLLLTTLPSLILWGFTLYILVNVIEGKTTKDSNMLELEFSIELGQMIHQLQRERDMSILYLSALGPETKTFLLSEYINSDKSINALSSWPVDFDTARSIIFASKENMLQHLSSHRQTVDKNNYDIYSELDFYNYIIDTVLSWLITTISKGKYQTVWKTLVAYLKITHGKQDVGVERALGTFYFVKGGFYDQDKFEMYNRRVHKFQAFYYTAKMYSDRVEGLYKEGFLSAGYNVTAIINDYRYEIQNAKEWNKAPDLRKAQVWFDNMTVYMDALYGIQRELDNVVTSRLKREINSISVEISINVTFLVLVIVICPFVVISTENLTTSIQNYATTLVTKTKELSREKKRTDSLLYQMVPKPVADKLKRSLNIEAEYFKIATILFSDVYQFSLITADLTPIEVIELLNSLYIYIDECLDSYDVYKVETINECYMVASGLPKRNKERHYTEIANLSIEMLKNLKSKPIQRHSKRPLQLRIGINSGPCMAGIVGTVMPRYCLFGDTINTASRMKSYGHPNRIQISDTTYSALRRTGLYVLKKRGHIDIKGKGVMMTHWLLGKQNDDSVRLDMDQDGCGSSLGDLPGEITQFHDNSNLRSVLNYPMPGRKHKAIQKTAVKEEDGNSDNKVADDGSTTDPRFKLGLKTLSQKNMNESMESVSVRSGDQIPSDVIPIVLHKASDHQSVEAAPKSSSSFLSVDEPTRTKKTPTSNA